MKDIEIIRFENNQELKVTLTKKELEIVKITREYNNCIESCRKEIIKGLTQVPDGLEAISYVKTLWENGLDPIFELTKQYIYERNDYVKKLDSLNSLKRYVYNALEFDEFENLAQSIIDLAVTHQENQYKSDMRYQNYDFWSLIGKLGSNAISSYKNQRAVNQAAAQIKNELIKNAKMYLEEDICFDIGNLYFKLFDESSLDFYSLIEPNGHNLEEYKHFSPYNITSWIYVIKNYHENNLSIDEIISTIKEVFPLHPLVVIIDGLISLENLNLQKLLGDKELLKSRSGSFKNEEIEVKYALEVLYDRVITGQFSYFNTTDEIISSYELYYKDQHKLGKKVYLEDIKVMILMFKEYQLKPTFEFIVGMPKDEVDKLNELYNKFIFRICIEIIPDIKMYLLNLGEAISNRINEIAETEQKMLEEMKDLQEQSRRRKLEKLKSDSVLEESIQTTVIQDEPLIQDEEIMTSDNEIGETKSKKVSLKSRINRTIIFIIFNFVVAAVVVNKLGPTISTSKFSSQYVNAIVDTIGENELAKIMTKGLVTFNSGVEEEKKEIEEYLNFELVQYGKSNYKGFLKDAENILTKNTLLYNLQWEGTVDIKPGFLSGIKNGFYVVFYPMSRGIDGIWAGFKFTLSLFFMKASVLYYIAYIFSYMFALCLFWAPIGVFMTKEDK
ncbi:hypothetical protein [Cetobacterium sp.]|uniref:hypothetical protein n=1 Tax=Cetobacterium sp. TaxID=2071632 RepID=UPI003EE63EC2